MGMVSTKKVLPTIRRASVLSLCTNVSHVFSHEKNSIELRLWSETLGGLRRPHEEFDDFALGTSEHRGMDARVFREFRMKGRGGNIVLANHHRFSPESRQHLNLRTYAGDTRRPNEAKFQIGSVRMRFETIELPAPTVSFNIDIEVPVALLLGPGYVGCTEDHSGARRKDWLSGIDEVVQFDFQFEPVNQPQLSRALAAR